MKKLKKIFYKIKYWFKYEARYAKEKEIRSTRIKERRRDPEHMEKFRAWNKASNKKTHESGKWA